MPVLLLLRSLLCGLLRSKLVVSGLQFARRRLSALCGRLTPLLRRLWDRLRSADTRAAVLSCVLWALDMQKRSTAR
ncbi:protein myomixer-like [Leucoraja erinacea]|uniref:protein myomixer-like n=1 Tax=Leucoraja erinaceus TaxID=7782 RepID=UPI0024568F2A|nr:protein myomixer-like [Leucoraja erinacea]